MKVEKQRALNGNTHTHIFCGYWSWKRNNPVLKRAKNQNDRQREKCVDDDTKHSKANQKKKHMNHFTNSHFAPGFASGIRLRNTNLYRMKFIFISTIPFVPIRTHSNTHTHLIRSFYFVERCVYCACGAQNLSQFV